MKLKKFLANLNAFIEKNPKALELDVVTSKDEEGNGFYEVYNEPELGNFCKKEFVSKEQMSDFEIELEINAICIN